MIEKNLVIGGCRSGKSRHALELATELSVNHRVFIATCVPSDDEMKQRVRRHQRERSQSWKTLEVPIHLPEAIDENSDTDRVILVDCLTLWMSNLLMENGDVDTVTEQIRRLIRSLEKAPSPIILVSNEVGTGIVPENRLARRFRDMAGYANQSVAACCDRVIWMVAGIPVTIKS